MEERAIKTLTTIKGTGPVDNKLAHLTELKADIKHRHCPEAAVAPLFEVVRQSITTPHLTDAGFSILGHLMKRLELQDQNALVQAQAAKTYPRLLERLADQKDRMRHRAIQALADFHSVSSAEVEQFVRDNVLVNKHATAKEAGMQWIVKTRKEKSIQFKTFVPGIVNCLEDADGSVRQTAQATIIELFRNAGPRGFNDLQKHLHQRNVRKTIAAHILSELGLDTPADAEIIPPVATPKQIQGTATSSISEPDFDAPPISVSEQEALRLEPLYVSSARDLEDIIRDMRPHFEGKETEQNWLKREKCVMKLRQITKGNAPQELTTAYVAGIRGLLDGILKTVNSLRTTVSTIGCHLLQDIARVAGPGLDGMVEIILQNMIKLCANTKKITAAKGNDTVAAIMSNVSYSARLVQHIHNACQDKNVQPRTFACGWLKILISKHSHHKNVMEHAGGLDLMEKCIKLGLADRDPTVRASMRSTYWIYARCWAQRSEVILSNLDDKQQSLLIEDPLNPNPHMPTTSGNAVSASKHSLSKSTTSVPVKPSIRETIAAQKKAKAAGRCQFDRPGSAQSFTSPSKAAKLTSITRPATAMSTAMGTLSSAPVRPRRTKPIPKKVDASPTKAAEDLTMVVPTDFSAATPHLRQVPADCKSENSSTTMGEQKTFMVSPHGDQKNERTATPDPFDGRELPHETDSIAPDTPSNTLREYKAYLASLHNYEGNGQSEGDVPFAMGEFNQRVSPSPARINGKKESLRRSLHVYEDPEELANQPNDRDGYPFARSHTPKPLGELPVNEPSNQLRLGFDHQSSTESRPSSDSHKKWLAMEAAEKRRTNASENIDDPQVAKKIFESGIDRVQSRTLDVHGFRKLQSLIRTSADIIWKDGCRFDQLLLPLLKYLETPNDELSPRSGKAQDLKTQVLVTVRLMLQYQPKQSLINYPRTLCAVIVARKYCYPTSYIISGLDETAERIVDLCDPEPCIDSVLDLLDNERAQNAKTGTTSFGLHMLADLLRRGRNGKDTRFLLAGEQEERMGSMGMEFLADTEPEIRQAVMEMLVELHDSVDEESFWGLLAGARDDRRSLVTYYLARRTTTRH